MNGDRPYRVCVLAPRGFKDMIAKILTFSGALGKEIHTGWPIKRAGLTALPIGVGNR